MMKLALITGGSKGLGKALVDLYLENGWEVREYSRTGDSPQNVYCDLSNAPESTTILDDSFSALNVQQWSEIVLINNAGIVLPIGPIHLFDPKDWNNHFQVNVNACVTVAGLFVQHFGERAVPKQIVNITSGAATSAYYGASLYCASKAAMESFIGCVALEQAQCTNPVTAYIVNPGLIDTQMQDQIRNQDKSRFPDIDRFIQLKMDNQLLAPEKVAKAIYRISNSKPQGGEKYSVVDSF